MTTSWLVALLQTVGIIGAAIIGLQKVRRDILEVHLSLNSRLDQLLMAARDSGIVEGRKREKANRPDDEAMG
jgi:hypothetical protein